MTERITLTALNEGKVQLSLTAMHEQGPQLFTAICDELYAQIKADRDAGRNPVLHASQVESIAIGRLMRFLEGTVNQETAYRAAKLASQQRTADRAARLML